MKNDPSLKPVGVFDSGIGGISVLAEMMKILPNENFIFLADAGNAPYGTKSREHVRRVSLAAARTLADRGVKALVVACNTATSVGIDEIRCEMPFPVIGMEPALKPAVETNGNGTILVMATPLTLQENKFHNLLQRFDREASIRPVPCPGLVELIESEASSDEIKRYLRLVLSGTEWSKPGAVVLGCTHYWFVREEIAEIVGPGVAVIDGNGGTARHLNRLMENEGLLRPSRENSEPRQVQFLATGDSADFISLSRRFLNKALASMPG